MRLMKEKRFPAAFKCYHNFHTIDSVSSDNLHFKMVIHVHSDSAFRRYQKEMRSFPDVLFQISCLQYLYDRSLLFHFLLSFSGGSVCASLLIKCWNLHVSGINQGYGLFIEVSVSPISLWNSKPRTLLNISAFAVQNPCFVNSDQSTYLSLNTVSFVRFLC